MKRDMTQGGLHPLLRLGPLILALLLAGCTRIVPDWQFEPDLDLSPRASFSIAPAAVPSGLSPDEQATWKHRRTLVASLVRSGLAAKGYREVADQPDLVVKLWAQVALKDSTTHQEAERLGTIDIVVMDPPTGTWLWHGWAAETITARLDGDAEIRKAVPLILEKFPPRPGSAGD